MNILNRIRSATAPVINSGVMTANIDLNPSSHGETQQCLRSSTGAQRERAYLKRGPCKARHGRSLRQALGTKLPVEAVAQATNHSAVVAVEHEREACHVPKQLQQHEPREHLSKTQESACAHVRAHTCVAISWRLGSSSTCDGAWHGLAWRARSNLRQQRQCALAAQQARLEERKPRHHAQYQNGRQQYPRRISCSFVHYTHQKPTPMIHMRVVARTTAAVAAPASRQPGIEGFMEPISLERVSRSNDLISMQHGDNDSHKEKERAPASVLDASETKSV